ncbi:alpha/beta hydrolase [Caenispirillum bisanense]|uniref:alpha/beta hydrolase n=1 Tax=Caenispirillum bisanense TaxID=414052 RepID=UPI0031DFEE06
MSLEILRAVPKEPELAAMAAQRPPLLFVHGAFCGAWIWEEHFLPFFADRGWEACAVSLRGHGRSGNRDDLDRYGMSDFIADVGQAMADLRRPAVLVGHSMGGMVVQKVMDAPPPGAPRPVGVVLMASLSPWGLWPTSTFMMTARPDLLREIAMIQLVGPEAATPAGMKAAMLSDHADPRDAERWYALMQPESRLATVQLSWLVPPLPTVLPESRPPVLVLGAERDVFVPPAVVEATACYYKADALRIFPDTAHAMMLEPHWHEVAEYLETWLMRFDRRR